MEGNYYNQEPFKSILAELDKNLGVGVKVLAVATTFTAKFLKEHGPFDGEIPRARIAETLATEAVGKKLINLSRGRMRGAVGTCVEVDRAFSDDPGLLDYVYETGPDANYNCMTAAGEPKVNCGEDALSMIDYPTWEASRRKKVTRVLTEAEMTSGNTRHTSGRRAGKHGPETDWIAR